VTDPYRELRLGGLFFLSAMAGLLFGGFLGAGIDGHGPPHYHWDVTPWFALAGTISGALIWLLYRYWELDPPKN
jgi:hypothetical protein